MAVLGPAGAPVCLDFLSAPEAFARLYPKLLDGYLLDAIEALDGPAAGEEELARVLAEAGRAPLARAPRPGSGRISAWRARA